MSAYSRGRLARRTGRTIGTLDTFSSEAELQLFVYGLTDEDDTLRTGVDNIQAWYVADMLAARRAADENRFREWVRSQRVAG